MRIYTIRTYKGRKRILSRRTKSPQRFFNILRTIFFRNSGLRAYIKIDYGDAINEGDYYNRKDLMHAARAFNER